MDRHFCEVVPVYVRPQSMVDEQACFGVIVRCPSANFYGYRLARGDEAAIARIAAFFPRSLTISTAVPCRRNNREVVK